MVRDEKLFVTELTKGGVDLAVIISPRRYHLINIVTFILLIPNSSILQPLIHHLFGIAHTIERIYDVRFGRFRIRFGGLDGTIEDYCLLSTIWTLNHIHRHWSRLNVHIFYYEGTDVLGIFSGKRHGWWYVRMMIGNPWWNSIEKEWLDIRMTNKVTTRSMSFVAISQLDRIAIATTSIHILHNININLKSDLTNPSSHTMPNNHKLHQLPITPSFPKALNIA